MTCAEKYSQQTFGPIIKYRKIAVNNNQNTGCINCLAVEKYYKRFMEQNNMPEPKKSLMKSENSQFFGILLDFHSKVTKEIFV